MQPSSTGGGSEASKMASLSRGCRAPPPGNKVEGPKITQELSLVAGKLSCHLCYKMEEKYIHEVYSMSGFAKFTVNLSLRLR